MTEHHAITRTRIGAEPTDVPVRPTCTVTYLFNTGWWSDASGSERGIKIPYQVAFDGVVQARQRSWPQRIIGRRAFAIRVPSGTEVSLFLNTDSLEGARRNPVYAVTPVGRDVHVTVTETRGRAQTSEPGVTLLRTAADTVSGRSTDYYAAPLHGDIWSRISRVYTEDDARAQLPPNADAGVRAAVASIYRVLPRACLEIACTAPTGHTIAATFVDSTNPRQNLSRYDLMRDGLTRVHPLGYYVLFEAARVAQLTAMTITSCWRPSLGSIAHRAGVGLDVSLISDAASSVAMNRAELTGRGPDTPSVSAREPALHRERHRNRDAWTAEVNATMPRAFQRFRESLQDSPHVQQLFDPWFMDINTQDGAAPIHNEQASANERLHANHLHVTLNVPGIL